MAEGGTPNDASVLRPAIQIGTRGIAQILKVYQAGTEEIRKLLTQECEVIFECKVCRSLFRGLPNLIAHKRAYCMNEYVEQRKDFPNFYSSDVLTVVPDAPAEKNGSELNRLLLEPVAPGNQKANKKISKTNLVPMLSPSGKNSSWLKPKNSDDKPDTEKTEKSKPTKSPDSVEGENEMDENFANILKMIPLKDREAVSCSTCNKKFLSLQSLVRHVSHLHMGEQTLYKCTFCPSVFTYQRSCRRHLERKHHKVSTEISKIMKIIVRKATKVTRKFEPSSSPPQKEEKALSKTTTKFTNPSAVEVAVTEAKSNSNPIESAALTAKVDPMPVPEKPKEAVKEPEVATIVKERLTCPDCGKEFEKRSILDRHMKVCADYAKIAVTFDMSLVKGMQHLATNLPTSGVEKAGQSDNEDSKSSPGKKNRRKALPCRVTGGNPVDSDVESVKSEKSVKSDVMPMLQPEPPLKMETVSRPGKKSSNADGSLAKQTKLSNIETVLQFLKNPKKRSLMTMVENKEDSAKSFEKDVSPPRLEREVPRDNKSEISGENSKKKKVPTATLR